jgi:hypothetical protein
MKKIVLVTSLILICTSCFIHKGRWENGQCRPKNPNFKILKTPFKETDKLSFNKIYIADNYTKAMGYGFYSGGRLIYFFSVDDFGLKEKDILGKNWDNAEFVGYWRIENENIKVQYFSCGNSGVYIDRIGKIKGDTIFFERGCSSNPFKRKICWDKYVLSDMTFEK